ncbi:hypothetical protein CsSME_00027336 [Camellia sinensis var. sinensis]
MRKFRGSKATSNYIKGTLEKSSIMITNMIGPIEKISMANHLVRDVYYIVGGFHRYFEFYFLLFSLVVTIVSYMGKLNVSLQQRKASLLEQSSYQSCIESTFRMTLKATSHSAS